jgi:hypothetical protein
MYYPYMRGLTAVVEPHTSYRFRVDLYNLLHKLHDIEHVFTQQVMSALLDFTEGSLHVRVRSPMDGMLDEFLDMLQKDSAWVLRVVLLDTDLEPTVGYRLMEPFLVSHKLSQLDYDDHSIVHHDFVFGFENRVYERLSPSLKELAP